MINNNLNYNVNFTARLDLTNVKNNRKVWKNVAQIFEDKTQKTPYDFQITDSNSRIDIYALADNTLEDGIEHCCTLSKEATKKLMSYPAEKISQKLVKLLNVFTHQDKTRYDALDFLKKLEKDDKYGTLLTPQYKDGNSIYDRILYPVFDKMKEDRIVAMQNDTIFKDANFID